MRKHFGIGRETTSTELTTPVRFFPVVADTQEKCVLCGYIDERDRMQFVGFSADGETSNYVCSRPHIYV